jgi:phage terminase large subunit-like protein
MRLGYQLDPVAFAADPLGFTPDEQQARVLDVSIRRGILNCSRQWGKSTITAIKAVHWAYTRPGSNVLIASPSERQSGEFLEKARAVCGGFRDTCARRRA